MSEPTIFRSHDLVNARFRMGLSAAELSRLFFINPSTVSRWENSVEFQPDPLYGHLVKAFLGLSNHDDAPAIGAAIANQLVHDPDPLGPLLYLLDRYVSEAENG